MNTGLFQPDQQRQSPAAPDRRPWHPAPVARPRAALSISRISGSICATTSAAISSCSVSRSSARPVEAMRPHDLVARTQVEQAERDAKPAGNPLDGAIEQEVDAEVAADRGLVAALRGEAGQRAGGHQEDPAKARQRGGDLVGEPGRKMRLVLGGADQLHRQHAHPRAAAGRLGPLLGCGCRARSGRSSGFGGGRSPRGSRAVSARASGRRMSPRPLDPGRRDRARRRVSRPRASGSPRTVGCRAGRSARCGSARTPAAPCRARPARHTPASAPARRPHGCDRSPAVAALPE